MRIFLVIAIISSFQFWYCCNGQYCEDYNSNTTSVCSKFVKGKISSLNLNLNLFIFVLFDIWEVYIPENYTQEIIDSIIAPQLRAILLSPQVCSEYLYLLLSFFFFLFLCYILFFIILFPFVTDSNKRNALELLCQTSFRSCPPPFFLPSTPCKSKCQRALDTCAPFVKPPLTTIFPDLIPENCDVIDPQTSQDMWPSEITFYSIFSIFLSSSIFEFSHFPPRFPKRISLLFLFLLCLQDISGQIVEVQCNNDSYYSM